MKKLAISAFMLAICAMAYGVDFTAMAVDAATHKSQYNALIDRLAAGDTSLSSDELEKAYYGFSFTVDYTPDQTFADAKKAYDQGRYDDAWAIVEPLLDSQAGSLDFNVLALLVAREVNHPEAKAKVRTLENRCDLIATAIIASGKGTTARQPFAVTSSADMERMLFNIIGVAEIVDRAKVGEIDAIKVKFPENSREHILYFDNTREQQFLKK